MTSDMGDLSKADKAYEDFEKREKKPLENGKQRYNVLLKNVERTLYQLHDEENQDCLRYRLLDHFDANEYHKDENKLKYEERVINSLDNLCIQLRGIKDFIDRNVEEMGPGRIGLRDGALKRMDRLPKQFDMAREKLDGFIEALYSDNGKKDPLTYWLSGSTPEPHVAEMSEYYKEKDVDSILNEDRSSIKNSDEFFKEILDSDILEDSRNQINEIKTKLNTWHLRFEITSQAASSLSTIIDVQDKEYVLVTPGHMEALKGKYVNYRADISDRVDSASMKFMDLFIGAQERTGYKTEGLYKEILSILPNESAVAKKIVREVGLTEIFGTSNPHKIRMTLKERLKDFRTNFDSEMTDETAYRFKDEELIRTDEDLRYREEKLKESIEGLRKNREEYDAKWKKHKENYESWEKRIEDDKKKLSELEGSEKTLPEKIQIRAKIEEEIQTYNKSVRGTEEQFKEIELAEFKYLEAKKKEISIVYQGLQREKEHLNNLESAHIKEEPLGATLSRQFVAYLNAYPNDEIDELYGQLVYDRKIEKGLKTVPEIRGAIARACEKSEFRGAYELYKVHDENGGKDIAIDGYKELAKDELLKLVQKAAEEGDLVVCRRYLTLLGKDLTDFFRTDKTAEASLLRNVDKAADEGELKTCEKCLTVLGKNIGDYLSADKIASARKIAFDKGKYDVAAIGYDAVTANFILENLCGGSAVKKVVKKKVVEHFSADMLYGIKPIKTEDSELEDAPLELGEAMDETLDEDDL